VLLPYILVHASIFYISMTWILVCTWQT